MPLQKTCNLSQRVRTFREHFVEDLPDVAHVGPGLEFYVRACKICFGGVAAGVIIKNFGAADLNEGRGQVFEIAKYWGNNW